MAIDIMERLQIEKIARSRFTSEWPDAQIRKNRYERIHDLYAPPGGDQWPGDRLDRPNKIHITANMVRAFVDIEARLLSVLPRVTNNPFQQDPETRSRAEVAEKLYLSLLESSGWDTWLYTWNQTGGLYGLKILKPFWNSKTGRPDVYVLEQPQNLLIGWGDSDFTTVDWAIYHYGLSPLQAKLRYPEASGDQLRPIGDFASDKRTATGTDHTDPLQQVYDNIMTSTASEHRTGYESKQVMVWDYWYKDENGDVYNCIHLNGSMVGEPVKHPEYPTIPYIPAEHDHEPGYPDGHGTAELLIDIQLGYNRALSHLAQYVWDETDPAYQLTGENAPMTVPPGVVPKGGEVSAPGPGTRIEPIAKGVNQFPLDTLIDRYWDTAYKITGIPEVLFGSSPGAQTSARAIAVQIEAASNRLDPRRRRSYEALRQLLLFWGYMITKKNMKVGDLKVRDVVKGLDRWTIIAPEIMPRDEIEHTQNVINKVNSKLVSLETAMDEVGVEAPLAEIQRVMAERSNAKLFPGDAQAIAAVMATLQSIQAQAQAQAAATGGGSQATANAGTASQDAAASDAQQAAPTGFEDQNNPMLQPGMAPPPGAPAPGQAELQPLVRQTPDNNSQSLSQIVMPPRKVNL